MTIQSALPVFKRGESFAMGFDYKDANGEPIDLMNITINSQIRNQNGQLVQELLVSKLDQTQFRGQASIYVETPQQTKLWPLGLLLCDIKLSVGNQVILSETFQIPCHEGVTE